MMKKLGIGLVVLLALAGLLLAAWYRIDGQPTPEARAFLTGAEYQAEERADGSLLFTPRKTIGRGVLIMHGALIKPLAYAETAAYFARRGYTVFVPAGALRLSINAVDAAARSLDRLNIRDWYLIGHSMGGMSSLKVLEAHPSGIRAVAMWAAAMPADFSTVSVPLLFLHGDHDGLLPPERLADAQAKLPRTTTYVTVPGGNHQNFARYSHQYSDAPATIDATTQIGLANERTAQFFAAH